MRSDTVRIMGSSSDRPYQIMWVPETRKIVQTQDQASSIKHPIVQYMEGYGWAVHRSETS